MNASDKDLYQKFMAKTAGASTKSMSNGSLMRLTPMILWAAQQ
jgi:hypothetical protein